MKCKFKRSVIDINNHVFLTITELQKKKLDVFFAECDKFSPDEKCLLCKVAKQFPGVADLFICGKTWSYKIIAARVNVPDTIQILLEKE